MANIAINTASSIQWISGEEVTVTTEDENWIPETNELNLQVGIYGTYSGVPGSGRFGIKKMDSDELVENYFALKYDARRDIDGVEGGKWLDIFAEILSEIERRYFILHNIPEHFIEVMKYQGGTDWNEEHYDEMAAELEKAIERKKP